MTKIPTDEQIRKEIRDTIAANPGLRQCINCIHYDRVCSECDINHMKMYPYVAGCGGRHYETAEELLLRKAKEELTAQALECDKIENLLALAVTTSHSATCFLADLEKRIKGLRKKESDPQHKHNLKKDLDLVESMQNGMSLINGQLTKMSDAMQGNLDKIDSYYRWYIEPHILHMFSENGKLDYTKSDGHLNNSMEFCRLLVMFVKKCICNKENSDKVFALLDSLTNDTPYALTDKDAEHYRLRD